MQSADTMSQHICAQFKLILAAYASIYYSSFQFLPSSSPPTSRNYFRNRKCNLGANTQQPEKIQGNLTRIQNLNLSYLQCYYLARQYPGYTDLLYHTWVLVNMQRKINIYGAISQKPLDQ